LSILSTASAQPDLANADCRTIEWPVNFQGDPLIWANEIRQYGKGITWENLSPSVGNVVVVSNYKLKRLFLALIVFLALVAPGCKHKNQDPQAAKCEQAIQSVPELVLFLKQHPGQESSETSYPLQGVEIALTLDWNFEDGSDPSEQQDNWCYPSSREDKLNRCLRALKDNAIPPAADFVVGQAADTSTMERWLQSGNIVGNLTFSRLRLGMVQSPAFIDDINKNDGLLRPLWATYPPQEKYFRYPGFRTGDNQSGKSVDDYLAQAGYIVVPATIDASNDKFGQIYCSALARGDAACAKAITDDFLRMLEDTVSRTRQVAEKSAGHDIKQIMVIETNKFTCDNLSDFLSRLKADGVRFISLDEALKDPFYSGGGAHITARGDAIMAEVRNEQQGNTEGN
jgi:peptidoglycan/xylan/chitin deacetylase (PgdA/CDA1 family)